MSGHIRSAYQQNDAPWIFQPNCLALLTKLFTEILEWMNSEILFIVNNFNVLDKLKFERISLINPTLPNLIKVFCIPSLFKPSNDK